MRLPEVYLLLDYWAAHPPVQAMVAAYLGVDTKSESRRSRAVKGGQHTSTETTVGKDMDVAQFLLSLGGAVKYGEGVQRPSLFPLPGVAPDSFPVPAPHGPHDPGSRPAAPPVEPPPGQVIRDG